MASTPLQRAFTGWMNRYGMAVVLALVCAYYSWATFTEQQPRGAGAGKEVAAQIKREAKPGASILIVARPTDEDTLFAEALQSSLASAGLRVVENVRDYPRAARQALQKLADAGTPLDFIATTPECAAWTVFESLPAKFPSLGQPRVVSAQSSKWPTFLKSENLVNVANQTAVVAILAAGMTLVILTGGIDLSVGSLIALSAVLCTLLIRDAGGGVNATPAAMLAGGAAGIAACALIGACSGAMVTVFRMPPFIATLGVMLMAKGLAFKLARGQSIYELPDAFTWLGRGQGFFSIPHAVVLMAAIYGATHLLMARTALGRYLYAIGGNAQAARYSGVRTGWVLMFAYTFCGALAGVGGVLLASQLKSGSPTYGLSYELSVIAAVVVGGTSLSGGQGTIFGTLIGAFIIAVIQNGMNLTGVDSYNQMIVLGAIILGAVLLDAAKKRGWLRLAGQG